MSKSSDSSVWEMIKLGLILACYAVASCTVLALVNNFTAPKIEADRIAQTNATLKSFFPEADDFEQVTDFNGKLGTTTVSGLYMAKSNGKVIGGAAQVTGPTYDKATIITAIALDGTIKGLQFLENTDSPGFGQKASDPNFKLPSGSTFYEQFTGKNAKDGFKAGVTFDAISGATISSNGVASLMETGTSVIDGYFKEHNYE